MGANVVKGRCIGVKLGGSDYGLNISQIIGTNWAAPSKESFEMSAPI